MADNYQQPGDVIQFTAAADITSGQVVKVGQTLGIALQDIANGAVGSVALSGVFTCPKVSAAVIKAGESLTWDVSAAAGAGEFDDNAASPATGDVTGPTAIAFEDAGNGATTLAVKFTGVPGTVA